MATKEVTTGNRKQEVILNTLQAAGLKVDEQVEQKRNSIHEKRGVVGGLVAAIEVISNQIVILQTKIDKGEIAIEDGKKFIQLLIDTRKEIEELKQFNFEAWLRLQGEVSGLEVAIKTIKQLYDLEVAKQERRRRMMKDGETDAGGRPLPLREVTVPRKTRTRKKGKEK